RSKGAPSVGSVTTRGGLVWARKEGRMGQLHVRGATGQRHILVGGKHGGMPFTVGQRGPMYGQLVAEGELPVEGGMQGVKGCSSLGNHLFYMQSKQATRDWARPGKERVVITDGPRYIEQGEDLERATKVLRGVEDAVSRRLG
ncbi:hypothetical protein GOP47_0009882, partial [Adiantum capillus-veneris]